MCIIERINGAEGSKYHIDARKSHWIAVEDSRLAPLGVNTTTFLPKGDDVDQSVSTENQSPPTQKSTPAFGTWVFDFREGVILQVPADEFQYCKLCLAVHEEQSRKRSVHRTTHTKRESESSMNTTESVNTEKPSTSKAPSIRLERSSETERKRKLENKERQELDVMTHNIIIPQHCRHEPFKADHPVIPTREMQRSGMEGTDSWMHPPIQVHTLHHYPPVPPPPPQHHQLQTQQQLYFRFHRQPQAESKSYNRISQEEQLLLLHKQHAPTELQRSGPARTPYSEKLSERRSQSFQAVGGNVHSAAALELRQPMSWTMESMKLAVAADSTAHSTNHAVPLSIQQPFLPHFDEMVNGNPPYLATASSHSPFVKEGTDDFKFPHTATMQSRFLG